MEKFNEFTQEQTKVLEFLKDKAIFCVKYSKLTSMSDYRYWTKTKYGLVTRQHYTGLEKFGKYQFPKIYPN